MNITLIRKKQVKDDKQYDELIKRLDEHIRWMKELQKKSEEEKLVEWVSVEKKKGIVSGNLLSNSDIEICFFSYVK